MRVRIGGQIVSDDRAKIYRKWGYEEFCCPQDIRDALDAPEDEEGLIFELNSGGGSIFAGYEMYTVLRNANRKTTVEIQSIAASAASVFVMGADRVLMSPVASIMIHRASSYADGNEGEMERTAQMLRTIDQGILNAYEAKCGGKTDRDTLEKLMKEETFMTAGEAVNRGFADGILWEQEDPDTRLTNSAAAMAGGMAMVMAPLPTMAEINKYNKNEEETTNMTLNELKQQHPELYAQTTAAAKKEERERLKAIDGMSMAGYEDIVERAKDDPNATAETVAMQIIIEQKKQGKNWLQNRKEDVKDSGTAKVKGTAEEKGNPAEKLNAFLDEALGQAR